MARTQEVVVMDIGSSRIRMLVVEKPNNGIYSVKHIVEVAYDGHFEGEWVDGDSTAAAIAHAIAKTRDYTKIRRLFVGVPGAFCMVKTGSNGVSFAKRRKVERADLEGLFQKANPFANDPTYVVLNRSSIYYETDAGKKVVDPEGMPTSELTGKLSFVACKRAMVDYLDQVLHRHGINDIVYTCGIYAEMMCLFEPTVRDSGMVLMVDAGYLSSTVALMRGDGLYNMCSFSCGSGVICAWMQEVFELSFEAAVELYDKIDLSYQPREGESYTVRNVGEDGVTRELHISIEKAQAFMNEAIAHFAGFVQMGMQTFSEPMNNMVSMYLTGGAFMIHGAADCFGKKMGRYIKVAVPTMCPEYKQACCSGYIGLAHFAFQHEESKRRLLW